MNKTIKKTLGDVKEFVISRAKWAHSTFTRHRMSLMLDENGMQCCLGIYASACHVPSDELLDTATPEDVVNSFSERAWNTKLVKTSTNIDIVGELINANDSIGLSDRSRERKIRSLFKKLGITVHFTK